MGVGQEWVPNMEPGKSKQGLRPAPKPKSPSPTQSQENKAFPSLTEVFRGLCLSPRLYSVAGHVLRWRFLRCGSCPAPQAPLCWSLGFVFFVSSLELLFFVACCSFLDRSQWLGVRLFMICVQLYWEGIAPLRIFAACFAFRWHASSPVADLRASTSSG